MSLLATCDCFATLVVGTSPAVSLQTLGWCFPLLDDLLGDPDYLGDDRPLPGQDDIPYPRFDGRLETVLAGTIVGDVAGESGAPLQPGLTLTQGVLRNVAYLQANLTAPVTTGNGTRAATLTPAYGAARAASVHMGPLRWVSTNVEGIVTASLRVEVPGGRFA